MVLTNVYFVVLGWFMQNLKPMEHFQINYHQDF